MTPLSDTVMGTLGYVSGGIAVYLALTAERTSSFKPPVDEANCTRAQLIFLYLACGPALWLYGLWRLLGLWGKHS